MSVCGHAVPDPAPHLLASVLSSLAPSTWCPRRALTIPLPSHIQPLVFPLSPVRAGKLLLHPVTTFSPLTLSSHTRKYFVFWQNNNVSPPSYSAPAVCQVRRKPAQDKCGQACSRKSFSFPSRLLFLTSSTVVCLTPC